MWGKYWLTVSFSGCSLINGTKLTISAGSTGWPRVNVLFFTLIVPFDWNISLKSFQFHLIYLNISVLCACLCSLQTSVQLGFQCTLPETSLAPHHLHDNQDDHWVSYSNIDYTIFIFWSIVIDMQWIQKVFTVLHLLHSLSCYSFTPRWIQIHSDRSGTFLQHWRSQWEQWPPSSVDGKSPLGLSIELVTRPIWEIIVEGI